MPEPVIEPEPPAKVEFTAEQHAEINRIVQARTAEEARKAAAAKQTEIDTYLADEKTKQDLAQLEGIEKANAEAVAAAKRAEAAEARAAKLEADTAAKDALIVAGANPKTIKDALLLLGDGNLDTTVPALVERLPALFTTDDGAPKPLTPGITPPKAPKPSSGGTSMAELGQEALRSAGIRVPNTAA